MPKEVPELFSSIYRASVPLMRQPELKEEIRDVQDIQIDRSQASFQPWVADGGEKEG